MFLFILKLATHTFRKKHSNTSHVSIYQQIDAIDEAIHLSFKYISCFYLSLIQTGCKTRRILFKYISCFYLSKIGSKIFNTKIRFKYISCFYLSEMQNAVAMLQQHSNTSHVSIYLICLFLSFFFNLNSNTSHVSIYHLALSKILVALIFKYISCFYLSFTTPI